MPWPAEVILHSFISAESYLGLTGDDQSVRIWDLRTQKTTQKFEDLWNRWGQITTMIVSETALAGGTMLCCGTGRGQALIFK